MPKRPNILFILADDHACNAIGAYGSVINTTPHLDRIAREGARFDHAYCTNAICGPSRAAILTGTYNHINGVTTLAAHLDNTRTTLAGLLQGDGYQTGIFGKWHLGHGEGHDPVGFDAWRVLPGQGDYHDPVFIGPNGEEKHDGYVTDIIADLCLDWLDERDPDRPFMLMCHHKAPHRPWEPDEKHMHLYQDVEFPIPPSFDDDYEGRPAAEAAKMRIGRDFKFRDLKAEPPEGQTPEEYKRWAYTRYLQDYLRCVASMDDNIGRLLDYLDAKGMAEDTIVVYSSDQGFFLGEHGWYDKRFMYDESFRMPLLMRYPKAIEPGTVCDAMACNVDFAPTLMDFAGAEIPKSFQGSSLRPALAGKTPEDWPEAVYHRYWMHQDYTHKIWAHYGIRTKTHKLIHYYGQPLDQPGANGPDTEPYWELYDLEADPHEMENLFGQPGQEGVTQQLLAQLDELQARIQDEPRHVAGTTQSIVA